MNQRRKKVFKTSEFFCVVILYINGNKCYLGDTSTDCRWCELLMFNIEQKAHPCHKHLNDQLPIPCFLVLGFLVPNYAFSNKLLRVGDKRKRPDPSDLFFWQINKRYQKWKKWFIWIFNYQGWFCLFNPFQPILLKHMG